MEQKLAKIEINNHGLFAEHNMPCCVYVEDQPAVFNCNVGIFEPSWKAQEDGFILLRVENKTIRRLLKRFFGVGE